MYIYTCTFLHVHIYTVHAHTVYTCTFKDITVHLRILQYTWILCSRGMINISRVRLVSAQNEKDIVLDLRTENIFELPCNVLFII